MEAEERPRKLRKVSHANSNDQADGVSLSAPEDSSKPSNNITNSADTPAEGDEVQADENAPEGGIIRNQGVDGASESEEYESNGHPANDLSWRAVIAPDELAEQLSKNQLKKLRKQQEWEAGKDYRKAKRKQKTAERKARKRAARQEEEAKRREAGDPEQKPHRQNHVKVPVTIVIDCGFDHLMAEKERISLGAQLTRSYSDNSRASFQAHLVISSWGDQLKERFDTVLSKHYQNWKGVRFIEDDFVVASIMAKNWMKAKDGGKMAGVFAKYAEDSLLNGESLVTSGPSVSVEEGPPHQENAGTAEPGDQSEQHPNPAQKAPTGTTLEIDQESPAGEVIYLTSDSPNTLNEISPFSTYIVGGLVDKNRHKGICFRKALEKGIKTAKLPIGEYMEMQSRFVLATNHVVEIMLRWLECGDWGEAFMKVIPKRKGGRLRKASECQDSPLLSDAASSEVGEEQIT